MYQTTNKPEVTMNNTMMHMAYLALTMNLK